MTSQPFSAESKRLRVLYVEDRAGDMELALKELQKAGYLCDADRVDTEDQFATRFTSTPYDIVISDYRLPGWSGMDALRAVRRKTTDLPFILVTGTLGDEAAVECIKSGASDYVLKENLSRLPFAVARAMRDWREVAERKRVEEALRRSEDKFSKVFRASPDPMTLTSLRDFHLVEVNESFLRLTGYKLEEVLGHTTAELGLWADPAQHETLRARLIDGRRVENEEVIYRTKTGELRVALISADIVAIQNGECILGVWGDITERKRAEQAREKSESAFRSVVEGAPYGIYRVTDDGRILMANPALAAMLGYDSPEELVRRNTVTDIYLTPGDRERSVARWRDKEVVTPYEVTWKRKDSKQITVRLAGRLLPRDSGEPAAFEVFVENVSERKVLEQQFLQAQKMEAVGRLAGGVAHDFNNLLMIMGSCAQLLQESKGNPEKTEKYTTQIRDAVNKAASLTRQLLAFSRQQVLEATILDLNAVVTDLCRMLPRLLGEDIEIATGLEERLHRVSADRGQIEQVVMNLAVNARDAMPTGGKLTIETSNVEIGPEHSETHGKLVPPGPYVMLAVTDTGTGMGAETKARIFEPFFTTKEMGKGTGLGLATIYGIVKQSAGFIWVYSELGQGSTFKVYLPAVETPVSTKKEEAIVESAVIGTGTILLVEDEKVLREVTAEYLRSKGYTVLEAAGAQAAEELSKTRNSSIDVLITDLVMPGKNGSDLAQELLKHRPNLRILYMSGYTDRTIDSKILGPRSRFLQKPFSLGALGDALSNLLASKGNNQKPTR